MCDLVIPTLLEDVNNRMVAWGKQGQIDPFKNIYDVCDIVLACHVSKTRCILILFLACVPNDSAYGDLPGTL